MRIFKTWQLIDKVDHYEKVVQKLHDNEIKMKKKSVQLSKELQIKKLKEQNNQKMLK